MDKLKNKTVLFADLDGTLIKTASGRVFPEDPTDFRIRKDVLDCLKELVHKGSLHTIHIVTNQGGIPQFITEHEFETKLCAVTKFIHEYLKTPKKHITITAHYCTSTNPEDVRRKPNTGLLTESLLFPISVDKIFMIGDASGKPGDFSDSDKKTAENFGCDYFDVQDFINLWRE